MPLISFELNLILIWSTNSVMVFNDVANQSATFVISETRLYVPVVTLSTQDNAKLLQQLKSAFKRTSSWNKYTLKPELVEPSFQGINRLFVLSFENDAKRISNKRYYLPNVEIKDHNVVIDGRNFFDQPVKNYKITYENIRKIDTDQGDGYATGCLLDYPYFKDNYKMIAIDLSKQQSLDADPKKISQINVSVDLDGEEKRMFFISEKAKETVLDFSVVQ